MAARLSRQAQDGHGISERLRDTGKGVFYAGPGLHGAHADPAAVGDPGKAVRDIDHGAFRARQYGTNARGRGVVNERVGGKATQELDPFPLQNLDDSLIGIHGSKRPVAE